MWPQSLRTALQIVLESRSPMALRWGREAILFYNSAYRSIVGDRRLRMFGRPVGRRPHFRQLDAPIFLSAMARGESLYVEDELPVRQDGAVKVAHYGITCTPVWREDGSVGGTLIVLAAITETAERIRAERALRESEARYRDLYDNAPNAFFSVGIDGRIRHCNMRAGDLLGFPVGLLIGRHIVELYADTPAGKARALEVFRAFRQGDTIRGEELQMRCADGSPKWVSLSVAPVHDSEGNVVESRSVVTDITERMRAVAERDRAARDAAEQRGRLLALLDEDRRKNEFLAMLSHELRNPLAPIRAGLEVLERAPAGSDDAVRTHAIVGRQVAHLSRLVDDLVDVGQIVSGQMKLDLDDIELSSLVACSVEDHRDVFVERGVALSCVSGSNAVWVRGDATRLKQVVDNLVTNAAKFTPAAGETRVYVGRDDERGLAVIEVRDSGRGIDPSRLSQIFGTFTQVDTTIDRSLGGLGLGLALVKGLVERLGGHVCAESEGVGQGATFTVTLPLVDGPDSGLAERSARSGRLSRRVLIIEDNVDAAEMLKLLLELDGHVVEVVHTGAEGVARTSEMVPEIVLCDIGLPGMDGYEVARALRAKPELESVRLVALTGYALPSDVAKSRAAGFDSHFAKPIGLEELEDLMRTPASASQPTNVLH